MEKHYMKQIRYKVHYLKKAIRICGETNKIPVLAGLGGAWEDWQLTAAALCDVSMHHPAISTSTGWGFKAQQAMLPD